MFLCCKWHYLQRIYYLCARKLMLNHLVRDWNGRRLECCIMESVADTLFCLAGLVVEDIARGRCMIPRFPLC